MNVSELLVKVSTVLGLLGAVWVISTNYQTQVGRVERLEEQIRIFDSKTNAMMSDIVIFKDQIRTLESKLNSAVSALAEAAKNPATVIDPIQQQCSQLTQQANSGRFDTALGSQFGKDVSQRAITLMKELGCGSTVR